MHTASKLSLAVLALALVGTSVAQAQSANITATATVLTPLTLTGTANLAFGNVFPGINKTVAAADATSGRFTIAGNPGSQVSMTFTLPTNLTGPGTLAIATWTGEHNNTNTTGAGLRGAPARWYGKHARDSQDCSIALPEGVLSVHAPYFQRRCEKNRTETGV